MSALSRKRRLLLSILLILVAGIAVYSNHFENPFVFDDKHTIEESFNVRQLPDVVAAMGAPGGSCVSGRPLAALSLAANFSLAKALTGNGLDVVGYHVFNLLAHLAAAVCLLLLARRLLARYIEDRTAEGLALAIAALWVVHPLHTAAIDHVSYRNETMAAFFYLATWLAADHALCAERSWKWPVVAAVLCTLGMMCKEVMVSAPIVVLLWDRARSSGTFREGFRRHWRLHAPLAATWGVLAWSLAGADRGEFVGFGAQGVTGWSWLLTQSEVLLRYLRLVFWPSPLVLDASDWPVAASLGEVWPSALVAAALFAAAAWTTWRRKPLGVVALAIFAVLAPTSSVIPITGAVVGEHRMVLPLAGVLALLLLGAHRVLRRVPGAATGGALLAAVLALGVVTFQRNADYHSLLSIWQDTLDKRPNNTRAYEHLCDQYKADGRLDLAEEAYRKSLAIDPDQAKASYNLGLLLAGTSRMDEAQERFRRALELDPEITTEAFLVGWAAFLMGRVQSGLHNMRSAQTVSPELADDPRFAAACLRMAGAYAVAREPVLYDPAYAAELARRLIANAADATDPQALVARARARDTLATALANLGHQDEALAAAAAAVADARAAGRPKLVAELEARAKVFAEGRGLRAMVTQRAGRP